jgi:hypothetical protein
VEAKPFAVALAVNRVAMGARFALWPRATGPTWVGRRAAGRSGVQVLARAVGARDVGLGAGALAALASGDLEAARGWMAAHAIADGTDLAATLAAARRLPAAPAAFALGMAAASTAVAVWSAATLAQGTSAAGNDSP